MQDGRLEFTIDGKTYRVVIAKEGDKSFILFNGHTYKLKEIEDGINITSSSLDNSLKAPMPGRITKILVNVGDIVKPKQQLIILEAMKMEHIVTSPYAGTVSKIYFKENDQVKDDQLLLKIDPIDKLEKTKK